MKHVINDALIRRQSRMFAPRCEFTLRNRRLEQMTKDPSIGNLHETYTPMHLKKKKKRLKMASATYTTVRLISREIRYLKCPKKLVSYADTGLIEISRIFIQSPGFWRQISQKAILRSWHVWYTFQESDYYFSMIFSNRSTHCFFAVGARRRLVCYFASISVRFYSSQDFRLFFNCI